VHQALEATEALRLTSMWQIFLAMLVHHLSSFQGEKCRRDLGLESRAGIPPSNPEAHPPKEVAIVGRMLLGARS